MRFAEEVERVLSERGWSLRRAEACTGVSAGTIQNMRIGRRVKVENVLKWAEAIGESPDRWLRIAMGRSPEPGEEAAERVPSPDATRSEIQYVLDPDTLAVAESYRGLPPAAKELVKNTIRSAAEWAASVERERSIGGRKDTDD